MIDNKGFTFYPEDWLDDAKLKHCSLAAKGMWIDLLCHMHRGDIYGYMIFSTKVMTRYDIQKVLKVSNQQVFDEAFDELFEKGIILQDTNNGAYYSKRMLQEHKKDKRKASEIHKSPTYPVVKEIIEHLNKVSGRSFPIDNLETFELIERWIKEGRSVRDFKIVNEVKSEEWSQIPKMAGYIRPRTLYGDKFLDYLNQNPNHKLKEGRARKWTVEGYYGTSSQLEDSNGRKEKL